jgi:membrane fusion protein (multidrug efflux system)
MIFSVVRRDAITVLLTMSFFSAGCGGAGSGGDATNNTNADAPASVIVEEISPGEFAETLSLTGYVKSLEDVTIGTEEGGVLRQWQVPRGGMVRRGDVLATLNDDVLRPMYEAATAQYQIAELNYRKQEKVFEEQGISEVQLKTSLYNRDALRAQADLARARLERTRVKSPIDGMLDDRIVDEGEFVPPGSPVARVVNLSRMKVVVNAAEVYGGSLKKGTPSEVTVSAYPGEVFHGTITFVSAAVVADNRTVPVEIQLKNPGGKLKPDMIARAKVRKSTARDAIMIDERLIQKIDQNTSVVYVEENGRAIRRSVVPGERNGGRIEIRSGLKAGDRLIVSGQESLFDGQVVSVDSTVTDRGDTHQ